MVSSDMPLLPDSHIQEMLQPQPGAAGLCWVLLLFMLHILSNKALFLLLEHGVARDV